MKELPLDKKDFWENELKSLGIEPKRMENDLNDKTELEALAEIIKQVYYQDYKTAYAADESRKTGHRDYPLLLLVFYSIRYFASCDTKNMSSSSISEERRRRFEICRECGAPNEPGMRQLDGSIKYVCTRNSRHIAYDNTDAE